MEDVGFSRFLEKRWGTSDLYQAARSAAQDARAGLDASVPLSTKDLRLIASRAGIRRISFDTSLAVAGALLPHGFDFNGLEAIVAQGRDSGRGRFTCAHEIAHAFLGTHGFRGGPPNIRRAEESFCDTFAEELLMPHQAAIAVGKSFRMAALSTPLVSLEDIARHWRISILVALRRMNAGNGIPSELGFAVAHDRPHPLNGGNAAPRVTSFAPRPALGFYLPRSRRLRSIGLGGGLMLFDWWREACAQEHEGRAIVASIREVSGILTVVPRARKEEYWLVEELEYASKESGRWRAKTARACVSYRFYGIDARQRYCLAAIRLGDG